MIDDLTEIKRIERLVYHCRLIIPDRLPHRILQHAQLGSSRDKILFNRCFKPPVDGFVHKEIIHLNFVGARLVAVHKLESIPFCEAL